MYARGRARTRKSTIAALSLGVVAFVMAGCGSDSSSDTDVTSDTTGESDVARIVVTNSILGSVVTELIGSDGVTVIIPNGKDPHDYEPSAQDVAEIMNADLVIETGLAYDEGLDKPIDSARDSGVVVFSVSDHVTLKNYDDEVIADASKDEHSDEAHGEDEHSGEAHGEDEHSDEAHSDEAHSDEAHDGHGHEGGDPHFLSDPETMKQMVPELVEALEEVTGRDLTVEEESLLQYFESTHSDVLSVMGTLGNTPCTLVTGHQSLRYFASRYQCEIVGAIIPSGSSTAEATAGELAELREVAEQADVRAIFVDEGTPTNVANQIASEIGVEVHELASHTVPDSGGYKGYVVALANAIVEGLTAE